MNGKYKKRKNHIVIIKGGLGNQIFIYYFALFLKDRFPADKVILETRAYFWLDYKYKAGFKLEKLGLEIKKGSFLRSIFMVFSILKIKIAPVKILNKINKSEVIVDDQNLHLLDNFYSEKNVFIYDGYFQDYKIIDKVYKKNKITFAGYYLSNKYKKLEREIKSNPLSIAFCIRNFNFISEDRFNYSTNKFNLLINQLIKQNKTIKFYIFAFKNINLSEYNFPNNSELITHENGYTDDKAILKIISKCNIKVISNSSTFHWIAAYISKWENSNSKRNQVYISKNYSIKNNLCYPEWIKY